MKGWRIFLKSVRLVLGNIEAAFRVSAVLYLPQVALQVVQMTNPPVMVDMNGTQVPVHDGGTGMAIFLLSAATLVSSLWIAVAWHRYVLAEETAPGWLPRWQAANMAAYLWRSILVGLIVAAGILVVSIPLVAISAILPLPGWLILPLFLGVGAWLFFRLGLVLPAAALSRPLGLREAWERTRGEPETFLVLGGLVIGGSILIMLPALTSPDPGSAINLVYGLVVNWFATMIGVSVLTSLYGHYVEGRSID